MGRRLEEILAGQFIESYLPYSYKTLPADLLVKEVSTGERFIIGDSTIITAASINHPGGNLGYRIEHNGAVFTYCSDVGHPDDNFDENVLKLAHGADLLLHDSHFGTMEERHQFSHWGHSTWLEAAQVAAEANVKTLALSHFSPDLTDDMVDDILQKARKIFPRTIIAREGLELTLPMGDELPT